MKHAVLACLLTLLPTTAVADTASIMYIPRAEHFIQRLYVTTGTSIDIALPSGETLTSNPIVGDPRWKIAVYPSGDKIHFSLKPAADMNRNQLLTIPGVHKTMFLLLRSGEDSSTTYTAAFFEPLTRAATMPVRVSAIVSPNPAPSSTPRTIAVTSCATPLKSNYSSRGDKRIQVTATCDDGHHTFILMQEQRGAPAVLPYKVDDGGRQDQISNATFAPATSTTPNQWIIDGVFDHWRLVTDSSHGQLSKSIDHVTGKP